mmetsp:Transcript_73403/g.189359  ORF Transcript_73403/g.189359 Transcript_73403/m.189359 type:complete len:207 (+) Transcript_73403:274-894(+)
MSPSAASTLTSSKRGGTISLSFSRRPRPSCCTAVCRHWQLMIASCTLYLPSPPARAARQRAESGRQNCSTGFGTARPQNWQRESRKCQHVRRDASESEEPSPDKKCALTCLMTAVQRSPHSSGVSSSPASASFPARYSSRFFRASAASCIMQAAAPDRNSASARWSPAMNVGQCSGTRSTRHTAWKNVSGWFTARDRSSRARTCRQ